MILPDSLKIEKYNTTKSGKISTKSGKIGIIIDGTTTTEVLQYVLICLRNVIMSPDNIWTFLQRQNNIIDVTIHKRHNAVIMYFSCVVNKLHHT